MRSPTIGERLRYVLDGLLARGTAVLVAGLFLTLGAIVVLIALVLTLTGTSVAGGPEGFGPLLWHNLLRTLDPGTMADDEGPIGFVASMLVITLVGVFAFSALVGVLSAGLEARFTQLRKGRSRVLERDHTVILGWSSEVFTVLSELVTAGANQKRTVIVVLADRDKVAMEDEIRSRLGRRSGARIICRSGDPADVDDIDIASVQSSRAVIVMSPETADPDADVLKTLLALVNDPDRRPGPYHIVAELQKPSNVEAAKLVGKGEVELVVADHTIAKIIAQTCRQSGLSVVYTELLNFAGDEIYVIREPALAGTTFGEALLAFEHSTLIGLQRERVTLNPPSDTPIVPEDGLIVIAADDDTTKLGSAPPSVDEEQIRERKSEAEQPEHTLLLGWNHRAPEILAELDKYVARGSSVHVVSDAPEMPRVVEDIRSTLRNTELTDAIADSSDRARLDAMDLGRFDHVVVLSYADDADVQHADARTLTTLVHLRDIATTTGAAFSITSEILDVRNRALGEVAKPDDFIVSNHIVSLLLAQIAESKAVGEVFADLFGAEGDEIYLRPADQYVAGEVAVRFSTVVEAARRRGEVALGYRIAALSEDPDAHYGVVFNPPKSEAVGLGPRDKVIVLASG